MSAVWNAVLAGAGTRPHIDCEKIDGQVYIKEVRFMHGSFDFGSVYSHPGESLLRQEIGKS